jgi:hypothetical protein
MSRVGLFLVISSFYHLWQEESKKDLDGDLMILLGFAILSWYSNLIISDLYDEKN